MSERERPESARSEPAPTPQSPERLRREAVVMVPERRGGLLLAAVALGGIGAGLGAAALLMPRIVVVQQLPATAVAVAAPAPAAAPAPPANVFAVRASAVWPDYTVYVDHPFLGVLVESECELRMLGGAPCARHGAHVVEVYDDSAAHDAGFQTGDVIFSFDDKPVRSSHDLARLVRNAMPDAAVDVDVSRHGERTTIRVAPR